MSGGCAFLVPVVGSLSFTEALGVLLYLLSLAGQVLRSVYSCRPSITDINARLAFDLDWFCRLGLLFLFLLLLSGIGRVLRFLVYYLPRLKVPHFTKEFIVLRISLIFTVVGGRVQRIEDVQL